MRGTPSEPVRPADRALLLTATAEAEGRHFWFVGLRRFMRPFIAGATRHIRSPGILDCGCGTGANLGVLAAYGSPVGLDLSRVGLQRARHLRHRRLVQSNLCGLPFGDASFDLVTAFDVLPNLQEPEERAAIAETFRVLRPGGALIVNVAALDILRGNHSVFGGELRRYTPGRLRQPLEEAGYTIERLTFTNFSLFPLMLVVRGLQRLRGLAPPDQAGTDLAIPPAPVNALLIWLLYLEASALRVVNMPIGCSLLCLARKPA